MPATCTAGKTATGGTRLPLTVVPSHYDLSYTHLDFETFKFEGSVSIRCKPTADAVSRSACGSDDDRTSNTIITLHSHELHLIKATLQEQSAASGGEDSPSNGKTIQAVEFRYKIKNQMCEIVFEERCDWVEESVYILKIDYIGTLNDQMCGLYRSKYVGLDGNTHIMATTQFEATDARRAFPCLDEPALKATFRLSVTVPAYLQCISNTPPAASHTTYAVGKTPMKTVTFQETPKMSTYLVALVVGQFDGISKTSNKIVTTVYTVPGKANQGHFCLDVASRCLDLFEKLFQIEYPLVKSDLFAIPDFAAGAMENWGCITYREAKILVKADTSETMKRGIARTTCHELAHQWFGNLVTMDFWTQLWLKEGVARFTEFVGIDGLFPEWDAWTEFVQSVYGTALSLDAMKTSHPVEVEVANADEIAEIFDSISYAKGASIVRMVASYIGMDIFFEGMRLYLTRHAYGNAVTNDLWGALQEASGKPIVDLMSPWTLEVGYPIMMLSEDGNFNCTRFLASGQEDGFSTRWPIPVTAKVEGMDEVQGPWVVDGPDGHDDTDKFRQAMTDWSYSGKWFKLNVDQTSFFRVSYSKEQWQRLSHVMNPDGPLSVTDRLGLISDSFAAGKAGYSSIVDSLSLVESFGEHKTADYVVWQELSENLAALASLFRSEEFFPKFQSFLIKLYSGQMDQLGWEASTGESGRTGTLRATVIRMMGIAGAAEIAKEAFDRFTAYTQNPDQAPIPGDLQGVIFHCALRHDEPAVFGTLKELYENPLGTPEEHRNCLTVMGCVKDKERHAAMLEYIFFSGKVRVQDFSFPLASLSRTTDEGGRASWDFFVENYSRLRSGLGYTMWGSCVGLSCGGLTKAEDVAEVEEFFGAPLHDPGAAKRRLSQALEVVRTKIERRDRDRAVVAQYLEEH